MIPKYSPHLRLVPRLASSLHTVLFNTPCISLLTPRRARQVRGTGVARSRRGFVCVWPRYRPRPSGSRASPRVGCAWGSAAVSLQVWAPHESLRSALLSAVMPALPQETLRGWERPRSLLLIPHLCVCWLLFLLILFLVGVSSNLD